MLTRAIFVQVKEQKERERQLREEGSFDPLTLEEREGRNRMELEILMDKLAYTDEVQKGKKSKEEKPKTQDDDNLWPTSNSESEEEQARGPSQHKSYLQYTKGRKKPKKGVPTEFEKMQIAVREAKKAEKEMKNYREEEEEYLKDLVLCPSPL